MLTLTLTCSVYWHCISVVDGITSCNMSCNCSSN
jgi:hypothetical protein